MSIGIETIAPAPRARKRAALIRAYIRGEHFFYSFAAAINLLILATGFAPYFLHHRGEGGRNIHPVMEITDFVHGMSVTAWYSLFLVQALLVSSDNRRLHMRLGWLAVALVPLVTLSTLNTAVSSVREMPDLIRFEMPYPHFLLVMLTDITWFAVCATAGIFLRKRPRVHRVLMLMASLSLLNAATSRIPWLDDVFGGYNASGFFGPVWAWGALLTILSSLRLGALDRRLATGVGLFVMSELTAGLALNTATWAHWVDSWAH